MATLHKKDDICPEPSRVLMLLGVPRQRAEALALRADKEGRAALQAGPL